MTTQVDEIADAIYRIHTAVALPNGTEFSYNQYLIADDAPMLFHTGHRRLFKDVHTAVARVIAPEKLRYIGFSHVEGDECGALNEWLVAAPEASPVCSKIAAMTSINDMADRQAKALGDGEILTLGQRQVRWFDAPHLPHGWECGYLFEESSKTLFCGDLYTQPGKGEKALVSSDILSPSEVFRQHMDYFAHSPNNREYLAKLAAAQPMVLACMHGSAWHGDGAGLLMSLADALEQGSRK